MLTLAVESAQKAGEILTHYFEMTGLERTVKDDKSFVTKADTEAEEIIASAIKRAFPKHGIVGEEGTDHNPRAEYLWVVDPVDGTNNFVNGIPLFAVSIAVIKDGLPVVAVVYNPVTNSLYTAERGGGMEYNGKKTTVSNQTADLGLVSFGPGGAEGKRLLNVAFTNASARFKTKRYFGATALELAYLARGGTEAFVCLGLKKWDYAAGTLLVEEAGGTITDLKGNPWTLEQNYFCASNSVVHDDLISLTAPLAL